MLKYFQLLDTKSITSSIVTSFFAMSDNTVTTAHYDYLCRLSIPWSTRTILSLSKENSWSMMNEKNHSNSIEKNRKNHKSPVKFLYLQNGYGTQKFEKLCFKILNYL